MSPWRQHPRPSAPGPVPPAAWRRVRLVRPLAEDEHRAHFWVRHVRIGVVLSEVTALAALVYVLQVDHGHRHRLLGLIVGVVLSTPVLLALPVERIARHRWGSLLPALWSLSLICFVTTGAVLDGGGESPLLMLLFLTLAFAGLSYPPAGVTLLGSLMTTAAALTVALDSEPLAADTVLLLVTLVVVTAMTAWAAGNHWDTYDRQLRLAEQLATLLAVDELTGALNRRGLMTRLDDELQQPGEHTLLMVDLDGFKLVNDSAGHGEGDTALVACTDAMRATIREHDALGRLGGDEFAVLLPHTALPAAARVAEDVRAAVATAGRRWGVTASIGTATRGGPADADALLLVADAALYEAKRAGRNRVIAASQALPAVPEQAPVPEQAGPPHRVST